MLDFDVFVLNVYQLFFAFLAAVFGIFILADLEEIKERSSLESRRFFGPLLASIFVGLCFTLYQAWSGQGFFLAPIFSFFTVIGLLHPKYAAGFFLFLLLTRPWETMPGQMMESMPRDYFYVVVLSLAGWKLRNKDFSFRFNFASLAAGAFAVWVFLSAFQSPQAALAVRIYVEIFFKGVVLFYALQNCFEKPLDLLPAKAALVLAILALGSVSAFKTYLGPSTDALEQAGQRLESVGVLANSNDIAAVLVLATPFCLFFFLKRPLRAFLWPAAIGGLALLGALIWASQSRGALMALAVSFGAYFVARTKSKVALAAIAAGCLLTVALAFSFLSRKGSDLEGSTNNRIIYWMAGANMALKNPVFGVGFWGFNQNFASYAVGGKTGSEGEKMTAHSAWIQVLSENGPVGLLLFAALWAYSVFKAWEIRFEQPEYLMGLAGYGCAISFLSHAYQLYPYILISLTVTHSFLIRERKGGESPGAFGARGGLT